MAFTQEEITRRTADGIYRNVRYENEVLRHAKGGQPGYGVPKNEARISDILNEHASVLNDLAFSKEENESLRQTLCLMGADEEPNNQRAEELFERAVEAVKNPINAKKYFSDRYFDFIELGKASTGKYRYISDTVEANSLWFNGFEADSRLFHPFTPNYVRYDKNVPIPCIMTGEGKKVKKSYITPYQVRQAKKAAQYAKGDVLVFGAGFGCFAYEAAQREEVTSVTVIDNDADAVKLFNTCIKPYFRNREKISVFLDEDLSEFLQDTYHEYSFCYVDMFPCRDNGFSIAMELEGVLASEGIRHMNFYSDEILYYSAYKTFLESDQDLNDADRKERISYVDKALGKKNPKILKRLKTLNRNISSDIVRRKALSWDFGAELFGKGFVLDKLLFA